VVVLGVTVVPSAKIGEDSGAVIVHAQDEAHRIEQYEYEIMKIPRRYYPFPYQ
jgi:hypothetical protein